MDWLSTLGTMQVDWKMTWLSFTLNDQYMFLQGKLPVNVECYVTEMYLIQQAVGDIAEGVLPEEMQQMLDNYQQLFEFPTELPPRNGCDHHIPFIPGATLVRSRPYRHSPELKTEI